MGKSLFAWKKRSREEEKGKTVPLHIKGKEAGLSPETVRLLRLIDENKNKLPLVHSMLSLNIKIPGEDSRKDEMATHNRNITKAVIGSGVSGLAIAMLLHRTNPQLKRVLGGALLLGGRIADESSTKYALTQVLKSNAFVNASPHFERLPQEIRAHLLPDLKSYESNPNAKENVIKSLNSPNWKLLLKAATQASAIKAMTIANSWGLAYSGNLVDRTHPVETGIDFGVSAGFYIIAARNLVHAHRFKKEGPKIVKELELIHKINQGKKLVPLD